MNKNNPEIVQLRLDIEESVSRKIKTPYDFEFLAGAIWERLHEQISPTTLKRLWGYIDGADTTRRSTLCMLSQFLGFSDWEEYLKNLVTRSDVQSQTFLCEGIHTDDLVVGNRVEVSWMPNRHCVFRYLGEQAFVVEEAQNSKLMVGDHFTCAFFLIGQPMYLDNLVREGASPVSYVAGSKTGITTAKKLNSQS